VSKQNTFIERTVSDDNFAHTLTLLGPCIAWIETIERGHVLDQNDLNMMSIPAEIALAFAKRCIADGSSLAGAAVQTVELLAQFRTARESRAR
jgi:hypothetical protein